MNSDTYNVVAVCGNEARIYGALDNGKRPFLELKVFSTHGAAKYFAQSYEDLAKKWKFAV